MTNKNLYVVHIGIICANNTIEWRRFKECDTFEEASNFVTLFMKVDAKYENNYNTYRIETISCG